MKRFTEKIYRNKLKNWTQLFKNLLTNEKLLIFVFVYTIMIGLNQKLIFYMILNSFSKHYLKYSQFVNIFFNFIKEIYKNNINFNNKLKWVIIWKFKKWTNLILL